MSEIRRLLAAISAAWKNNRVESLTDLFHERMTISGPDRTTYAAGRDACIETYREFATNVAVLAYRESAPVIEVWGDTAIAHYGWTMTYRRDTTTSTETGTDHFVLGRSADAWRVLHRMLLAAPVVGPVPAV